MSSVASESITIAGEDSIRVSGLLQTPPDARACYVLAHGAGAGMQHPFMAAVAAELAQRGIATLRFQFPYMENRSKRSPDRARAKSGAAFVLLARSLHFASWTPAAALWK